MHSLLGAFAFPTCAHFNPNPSCFCFFLCPVIGWRGDQSTPQRQLAIGASLPMTLKRTSTSGWIKRVIMKTNNVIGIEKVVSFN